MLLERIDLDPQGSLHRVHLGPFSHQLNAIYGPAGSGKSTILRFLRETLLAHHRGCRIAAEAPMGRVVWAGRDGRLHYVRQSDGHLNVDFEPRHGTAVDTLTATRAELKHLTAELIDGIVISHNDHSVSGVVTAAMRGGLDRATTPIGDEDRSQRLRLQHRISELDALLGEWGPAAADADPTDLHRRRRMLQEELRQLDRQHDQAYRSGLAGDERRRLEGRAVELEVKLRRLSDREAELQRILDEIDHEWRLARRWPVTVGRAAEKLQHVIASTHRSHLEDLDQQLIRWRRALRDLRELRQRLSRPSSTYTTRASGLDGAGQIDAWSREGGSLSALESRLEATQREIDWLTRHYDAASAGTAESSRDYLGGLSANLRDLKHRLEQFGSRFRQPVAATEIEGPVEANRQLDRCEQDLLRSIDVLIRYREQVLQQSAREQDVPAEFYADAFGHWRSDLEPHRLSDWLLSDGCPPRVSDYHAHTARVERLQRDREEYARQHQDIARQREVQQHELAELRHRLTVTPVQPAVDSAHRDTLRTELAKLDCQLERLQHVEAYRHERDACQRELTQLHHVEPIESALAARASFWLRRLSGGRLRQIAWRSARRHDDFAGSLTALVQIDGRSDSGYTMEDRYLATLAVRMAAVDELARRGQPVPILIETPAVMDIYRGDTRRWGGSPYAGFRFETAANSRYREAYWADVALPEWLDTVMAFADSGHQTILLTRYREAADRIAAAGGTVLAMPQGDVTASDPLEQPIRFVEDVNADLDRAWRDAYGLYDNPDLEPRFDALDAAYQGTRTGATRPSHTQAPVQLSATDLRQTHPRMCNGHREVPESPFFLTADSPVDQAPSVDAVAGAKLRGVGIARIGQLLVSDAGRLADALGIEGLNEAAVRDWQNESRLMCRVPQLRGFDARVLVGCGISEPQELASMHPGELLDRVESFLATERGRLILRSGSSYELSRITSWIAAANRSVSRESRHGMRRQMTGATSTSGSLRTNRSKRRAAESNSSRSRSAASSTSRSTSTSQRYNAQGYDAEGYDRSGYDADGYNRSGFNRKGYNRSGYDRDGYDRYGYDRDGYDRRGFNRSGFSRQGNDARGRSRWGNREQNSAGSHAGRSRHGEHSSQPDGQDRAQRDSERAERRERRRAERRRRRRESDRRGEDAREVVQMTSSSVSSSSSEGRNGSSERSWKFYLERKSPIVDAPTIGPRTAHKLEAIGVHTVGDLLAADAAEVAEQLGNRRIDAEEVRAWQWQATLVCRIPMLRGHDAQLLVAAGVFEPEQVLQFTPAMLLDKIIEVARSSEGKRILRGSPEPDLKEITEWIDYAGHHRDLRAA